MGQAMHTETIGALVSRMRTIESDLRSVRKTIDGEELAPNDRGYLSRCFDLLDMELEAAREFLNGLR